MNPSPGLSASMLRTEVVGRVATITINRPQRFNSIGPAVIHQLQQVFDQSVLDPSVKGIVLGGEGKTFVVGADVDFFVRNVEVGDFERILEFTKAGHRLLSAIEKCPKPVVACVHGAALGAGTEIALACRHIVASPPATFGFPETGLGIYPGFGGTQRTPRKVGVGLAKWLILSGKTLSANEAWQIGLIDRVVPPAELANVCRECARGGPPNENPPALPKPLAAIAEFFASHRADDLAHGRVEVPDDPRLAREARSVRSKAPIALQWAERLIEEGTQRPIDEALQMELDHIVEIFRTEDACRGLSFCAQRRLGRPEFVGR
jgi:enoyl-CoA hydratase/carnithine racemase